MLSCGNLAHGFAASGEDKPAIRDGRAMNIGIVTAFNDMLSAHQPYERYPAAIKIAAREVGATAQVAGGVPAMCDGGDAGPGGHGVCRCSAATRLRSPQPSRFPHAMFEGALMLGICDKIVPGMLMGALRFGHLPTIFVPAGPMPSGLANKEKQRVRQLYAEGKAGRAELLESGKRQLSWRGHLHLLRHGQHQPDDDGSHGPAHAGRRFRQSRHEAAQRTDARGGASRRRHRLGRQ